MWEFLQLVHRASYSKADYKEAPCIANGTMRNVIADFFSLAVSHQVTDLFQDRRLDVRQDTGNEVVATALIRFQLRHNVQHAPDINLSRLVHFDTCLAGVADANQQFLYNVRTESRAIIGF